MRVYTETASPAPLPLQGSRILRIALHLPGPTAPMACKQRHRNAASLNPLHSKAKSVLIHVLIYLKAMTRLPYVQSHCSLQNLPLPRWLDSFGSIRAPFCRRTSVTQPKWCQQECTVSGIRIREIHLSIDNLPCVKRCDAITKMAVQSDIPLQLISNSYK